MTANQDGCHDPEIKIKIKIKIKKINENLTVGYRLTGV